MLKHGFELMTEDELPSISNKSLFKNVYHFSENFLTSHLSKIREIRLDLKYRSEDEAHRFIKNVEKDSFKFLNNLTGIK